MTAPDRPVWWKPGMSAADIALWEAAERAAASAPELKPGDDIAIKLQQLFAGFPDRLRQHRAGKHHKPAA